MAPTVSIFLDFLTDEDGKTYEYGHCYQDYDDGPETGCGMEYAYYADDQRLDRWHDAVGQVTRRWSFTPEEREELDRAHESCHTREVKS